MRPETSAETYVVGFQVKPERLEQFLALLSDVLDQMRHEENFVSATLNRDPEAPNRFMLHETWKDGEDIVNVQLKRSYRDAWHNALDGLLDNPRDIAIWKPVRVDAASACTVTDSE